MPLRRAMSMPLLSADEERRLAIRIQQGDQAAKQRMIESNLRLVFSLARTYRGRGVPMADLVQEGTIGLAQAVERFDHRHEARFSTYATYRIHRSLRDAVAAGKLIRIPPRATRQLATVRRAEDDLGRSTLDPRSVTTVAERTGVSVENIQSLRGSARVTASLDEPVGDDGTPLGELVPDDRAADPFESAVADEESRTVRKMLTLLPERHRNVIVRRYGLGGQPPQSHEQIGAWLGVGAKRSRQLEHEALHRLRTVSTPHAA
jgi:RNA polymerase primary sigma factor